MSLTRLFLHPAAPLDLTRPSIHWSTVIGLLGLAALYWWRASVVRRAAAHRSATALEPVQPMQPAHPHARGAFSGEWTASARSNSGQTGAEGDLTKSASDALSRTGISSSSAPSPGRQASFAFGLFVIFGTLNGPIHDLSDYYLFSAHMVQHLLLTLIAAPLLVFGLTGEMLRPVLKNRAALAIARTLTRPAICFAIFNVAIAFWHLPLAYNAALANHGIHIVQHLTLLGASVLMWWPLMSPLPELPRLSYPGQMLYCFLMVIPMSVIAIYIALADTVLYPAYAAAPRIWGLTPMMDQHVGGLIMWIPGGLFFYVIMTIVFFRWARRGEDTREAAQVDWVPHTP